MCSFLLVQSGANGRTVKPNYRRLKKKKLMVPHEETLKCNCESVVFPPEKRFLRQNFSSSIMEACELFDKRAY